MKPAILEWATNNTYVGGPNPASNNKEELDAAHSTDGFVAGGKVEPEKWNLWRFRIAKLAEELASARICNLFESDRTNLVTIPDANTTYQNYTWGGFNIYNGKNVKHTLISCNTVNHYNREFIANGHHIWSSDNTFGTGKPTIDYGAGFAAATQVRVFPCGGDALPTGHASAPGNFNANTDCHGFASDGGSNRVAILNQSMGIFYSTDFSWWTLWPASETTSATWGCLQTDRKGVWVFHDQTNSKLYYATSIGGTLTDVGDVVTGGILSELQYSYHEANDLFYGDAGNPCWLFWGNAGGSFYKSTNGINWMSISTTGETISPLGTGNHHLRYSKYGRRWCVLNSTSTLGANIPTIIYSDNNGSNWTGVTDAFGLNAEGLDNTDCKDSAIETDGFGHWMVTINVDNGSTEEWRFWVSIDNALTWKRVFPFWGTEDSGLTPTIYIPNKGEATTDDVGTALWYGDGRFNSFLLGDIDASGDVTQMPIASLKVGD